MRKNKNGKPWDNKVVQMLLDNPATKYYRFRVFSNVPGFKYPGVVTACLINSNGNYALQFAYCSPIDVLRENRHKGRFIAYNRAIALKILDGYDLYNLFKIKQMLLDDIQIKSVPWLIDGLKPSDIELIA